MTRIMVTGGYGFIGYPTVLMLQADGHQVHVIDNLSTAVARPKPEDSWTFLDVRWSSILRNVIEEWQPEVIVHLAAQASLQTSWELPALDLHTNAMGTLNIVRICKERGIRLVFASTSAVYAPKAPGRSYFETDNLHPLTPYGISKMAAELYVRAYLRNYAILRYGNVYGPMQKPLGENQVIARAFAHVYKGSNFVVNGDGQQTRDYVYVSDVAWANVLAATKGASKGVYNIGTQQGTSVNEVCRLIDPDRAWEHGEAKAGELRSVVLSSGKAFLGLRWVPSVALRAGIAATRGAWLR